MTTNTYSIPCKEEKVKCVFYGRYSSAAQTEQSIEGQRTVCAEYAERENMCIVAEYTDRAKSGTSDRRPEFQHMISDIESGKIDTQAVLVYKLDRFARNRADSAIYKRKLKEMGIRVISATEPLTDTPEGIILESVLEGMDEYYSMELARKTRRGKEESLKKGYFINWKAPFGYSVADRELIINPVDAEAVRDIFNRYAEGQPLSRIAKDYKEIIPSKFWDGGIISRILHNRIYIGEYRYGTHDTIGKVPAIIDTDLFERVQALLAESLNKQRKRQGQYEYLLTGRFWCEKCHKRIRGSQGSTNKTHYYRCPNCGHHQRADEVHKRVFQALSERFNDSVVEEVAQAAYEQYQECAMPDTELVLQAQLDSINEKLDNATTAILNGLYNPVLHAKIENLQAQKESLEEKMQTATKTKKYTLTQFKTALTHIAQNPPAQMLKLFVSYVVRRNDDLIICIDLSGEGNHSEVGWEELSMIVGMSNLATINNKPCIILAA